MVNHASTSVPAALVTRPHDKSPLSPATISLRSAQARSERSACVGGQELSSGALTATPSANVTLTKVRIYELLASGCRIVLLLLMIHTHQAIYACWAAGGRWAGWTRQLARHCVFVIVVHAWLRVAVTMHPHATLRVVERLAPFETCQPFSLISLAVFLL